MRRAAIVCLLLSALAHAQSKGAARVREVLDEIDRAGIMRDVATLDRMYAPEYAHTNSDGSVMSRDAVLASYRKKPTFKLLSIERDDARVRIDKDVAEIDCHTVTNGHGKKGRFWMEYRMTYVFKKIEGKWKLASSRAKFIKTVGSP
jgi:ketosteroid isomerase-like protein